MIDVFVHSLHLQLIADLDSGGGKPKTVSLRHFSGHRRVKIVDLLQDPRRGLVDGIIVCPNLVRIRPKPKQIVMGNLSDLSRSLHAVS